MLRILQPLSELDSFIPMALRLNLLPVTFDGPDVTLPFKAVKKGQKPKDVCPDLFNPGLAAKLISNRSDSHIVFLGDQRPPGTLGNRLYELTEWHPLAIALIEQSLADFLRPRCAIAPQFIDRHPWGYTAFEPVGNLQFEHIAFHQGIAFRALQLPVRGTYGIVIDWKAGTTFRTTLGSDVMKTIAVGCSVMLVSDPKEAALQRFLNRYVGRVKSIKGDAVEVTCVDGITRPLPASSLVLEPKTQNFAIFDRSFPKLAPKGGITVARLQLDKTLTGNIRNRSLFKDRLNAALSFLAPDGQANLVFPLSSERKRLVKLEVNPVQPSEKPDSPIYCFKFPQPQFVFGNSTGTPTKTRKKTEGMISRGPFEPVSIAAPVFGFLFAEGHREDARKLYSALREGIGYFGGFNKWFRLPLSREAVVSVSGFAVEGSTTAAEAAPLYKAALEKWISSDKGQKPAIFFVVHDKTEREEETSPYYACKTLLLSHGIMTQNVTVDLIRNAQQFQWSAANIALGAFAKLGGTPWNVEPCSTRKSLIIGIGRTERHDPTSRSRRRYQAFATCVSSAGKFGFVSVYPEVAEEDFAVSLKAAVTSSLVEAEKLDLPYDSLVVHLTGDLRRDERELVEAAVDGHKSKGSPLVCVLSVSDRADCFAVTRENEQGLPSRGQAVRLGNGDYLLFTEGIEDLGAARFRSPCSVRVKIRYLPEGVDPLPLLAQVYDLSQVNFRGFNGASKPISILYSELIARILQCSDVAGVLSRQPELNRRMWFL